MDWTAAIEKNREALKRILASLAAMAGLAGFTSPPHPELVEGAGEDGSARRGEAELLAGEGYCSYERSTLPRHLHRAVLRLLRPTEAAARRLVIVAARGLVVELPPARPRKPAPKPIAPVLRSLGIAVVLPPNLPHPEVRGGAEPRTTPVRKVTLPLLDPIRIPRPARPRYVPAHAAPRILSFDGPPPHRLPPPLSPRDPIDAARLALRLAALASALDDLPGHARRFARWKLRRDRGLVRRLSPLRPGRPTGLSAANRRRPSHEVHDVLSDVQWLAIKALERPDTS